jgi:hypothetical protein
MEGDYMRKAGWDEYVDNLPDPRYPFLVDTALFCPHIEMNGQQYPGNWEHLGHAAAYEIERRAKLPTVVPEEVDIDNIDD